MTDLTNIEARVKVHLKNQDNSHQNKKNLKNPCHLHKSTHKWDECCQNKRVRKMMITKIINGNKCNERRNKGNGRS
jgi:hypothetical protein